MERSGGRRRFSVMVIAILGLRLTPLFGWTADNLLRHTVYVGLRENKPADQVRRKVARTPA
jgi:hypothetical protein